MPDQPPQQGPLRVVVAGNYRQAKEYLSERGWVERECCVVSVPHALRGVRGPIEVHRIGTYWRDRSASFIEEVEQSIAIIEACANAGSPE